ncbi:MAG: polysaccharide deacetylase family protein [Magnetococcus sp. YQC-5]
MNTLRPPPSNPPILLTVIDTEEEFDWHHPFRRDAVSVTAMDHIGRAQEIFDAFGVRPVYVVDYPVASQERGFAPIKEFLQTNRATLGAHLHPWNTPPYTEDLCANNSFPGNLPRHLEAAKLQILVTQIKHSFGLTPLVYKAGRYGVGANTAAILEEQGFEVDLSPSPPFDFQGAGGPDFSAHSSEPHWFGSRQQLLCLPTTGGYVGPFSNRTAHQLFNWSRRPLFKRLHLPGIMARLGLLNRLRLSPEGHTLDEMKLLTRTLRHRGMNIFSLSFHSPSLQPGNTPYVHNARDLQRFLGRIQGYLDFFLRELGGVLMPPLEIKHLLQTKDF